MLKRCKLIRDANVVQKNQFKGGFKHSYDPCRHKQTADFAIVRESASKRVNLQELELRYRVSSISTTMFDN